MLTLLYPVPLMDSSKPTPSGISPNALFFLHRGFSSFPPYYMPNDTPGTSVLVLMDFAFIPTSRVRSWLFCSKSHSSKATQ